MALDLSKTPREQGYRFPAEWEKHKATWLSYPHNENSWPGRMNTIYPSYHKFIHELSKSEYVNINVLNEDMMFSLRRLFEVSNMDLIKINFFIHPTNDAWCRDHGPAFLVNTKKRVKKIVVNWEYNAWGNKYPCNLDNKIPELIARKFNYQMINPGIVMEGGSVDFNGDGTLITSEACLLNENRNPLLKRRQIEKYLCDYYGVEQIIWLKDGIDGDDTDGHVDDITRFVNKDTVVTCVETNKKDFNYKPLQKNLKILQKTRLLNDKQLNIVELPMPDPIYIEDQRVPASYANFYIANERVIIPTYDCKNDQKAMDILAECFPDREMVGIDSTDLIWGLGSFHCLSQQEPWV